MLTGKTRLILLSALLVTPLWSCGDGSEAELTVETEASDGKFDQVTGDDKADAYGYREGTPEAAGILRVANETAAAILKSSTGVGLPSTTVSALVKARSGRDGRDRTADDVRFTTLTQLDAVPYTGATAFQKLLAYARRQGFVSVPNSGSQQGRATRTPFSGYWWSMQKGELALGWSDGKGRQPWTDAQARAFDQCLVTFTPACESTLTTMAGPRGSKLSPLMKYDLWFRKTLQTLRGGSNVGAGEVSRATRWELDNHYIGTNTAHRYWASRGYAGKCIGWALSTMFHDEPRKDVELQGIVFTPADMKGILAAVYNGAQFFIPPTDVVGQEYHSVSGMNTPERYADVLPHDWMRAVAATIDQGKILEADLDPGDGVWNYPIHAYTLTWRRSAPTQVAVAMTVTHADDEVSIDGVFSPNPARPDLKRRDLTFDLTVPVDWDGKLASATGGRWTGASVNNHPDVAILGVENGWRTAIYDYANTQMSTEVNFQLIKRAKLGTRWVPLVDRLLSSYETANR